MGNKISFILFFKKISFQEALNNRKLLYFKTLLQVSTAGAAHLPCSTAFAAWRYGLVPTAHSNKTKRGKEHQLHCCLDSSVRT